MGRALQHRVLFGRVHWRLKEALQDCKRHPPLFTRLAIVCAAADRFRHVVHWLRYFLTEIAVPPSF